MYKSSIKALSKYNIGWQALAKNNNSPSLKKYQEIEEKLSSITQEIIQSPKEVTIIDWDYWENKIDDKSLLDSIKQKHISKTFSPVIIEPYQTYDQFLKAFEEAKTSAIKSLGMIALLESEIQELEQHKLEWPLWTSQQHLDSVPGLEAEHDRLAADLLSFVPFDIEEALNSFNLQDTILNILEKDDIPEFNITIYNMLPPESPVRIAIEHEYNEFTQRAKEAGVDVLPLKSLIDTAYKKQLHSIQQ